ncbi:alpha/beta hydrolase [Sulfitobacter sp. S190]|uniref:alpha/beta hydrolase n=1 Tax=Sulfitobacter sp. S190 TaxID=2867022 RepID=UPI0021A3C812|nr:lysophospholipase [Sulfitobacter sp. S190]UWR21211.1 lysophospholipase [Sulfitobacter sp. S190]
MSIQSQILPTSGEYPALEIQRSGALGDASRPAILFLHGYTSGAWQFAEQAMPILAEDGWTSFALNLRGHGRSGGREGIRTARFADYASDVARAVAHIEGETGQTPILGGHSLGSVLVRNYAARHAVPAIALLSFGDIKLGMKGFMGWMIKRYPVQGMMGMLTGRPSAMFTKFGPQYDVMYAGHDRDAVRRNVERLMAQPDSDKVFMELGKLDLTQPVGNPPVFVMAGDRDPIASGGSVPALARKLGTKAVMLPGQAHDILAGPDWRTGVGHLRDWLNAQFPQVQS